MGQGTYFLEQAGLSPSVASTLNLCMFAVGACGTVASWPLMQKLGRRTIYFYGQIGKLSLSVVEPTCHLERSVKLIVNSITLLPSSSCGRHVDYRCPRIRC